MQDHLLGVDDIVKRLKQPSNLVQYLDPGRLVVVLSDVADDLVAKPVPTFRVHLLPGLKRPNEYRTWALHLTQQNLE
jgi:hypothetical protein